MKQQELIPHLFRTEYRKIVSVLTKRFGFDQLETAEDITSDTFLAAAQTWGINGLPENPVAWLYHVAGNKAKNYLVRKMIFEKKIAPVLKEIPSEGYDTEIDLSRENISDSQLQMMFAICHPSISSEAQIGLSLRILCGFGIDEIAEAFVTNKEAINKRLFRAREKLRERKIKIELPDITQLQARLEIVLRTIYLLFNEGYYSVTHSMVLRKDLCLEAIRLCKMLVEHESMDKPATNALLALMCFHASRFEARLNENGDQVSYEDQDERLWNQELVSQGGYYLNRATTGNSVSKYHIEAAIAYWGTQKNDTEEKWKNVLLLYDHLLQLEFSPVAALNRIFAISKLYGKEKAITEAENLKMTANQFYFALLGELYTGINSERAVIHFRKALSLTRSESAKLAIQRKLDVLFRAVATTKSQANGN